MIKTLEWTSHGIRFIDQTRLPMEEVFVTCGTYQEVATAIRDMIVRGAPAIGVAAAMGIALGVKHSSASDVASLRTEFGQICRTMGETRPTAVNLFWAIRRMQQKFDAVAPQGVHQVRVTLVEEAQKMLVEDIAANEAMGRHGATLMPTSGGVLTHCNAGALATCGYGTALGVIRSAIDSGKKLHVFADETRPFLQGSRLTAWELMKDGIQTTLIADNMAGAMMRQGKIKAVIVGADRIAPNGEGIPIEQRSPREVTHHAGKQVAPNGVLVENPAFDVTPNKYIAAIITERGVASAPYMESLKELAQ